MTINGNDVSARLALDVQGLADLRAEARKSSPEALKAAAKQFEAMFMNMMLKSMREAAPQDGMFDSEQTRMYTTMLDQQMSQSLASRGVGLADLMVRQLSQHRGSDANQGGPASSETPMPGGPAVPTPRSPPEAPNANVIKPAAAAADFNTRLLPHADAASRATGVPAQFILGQAALESGWGKREIRLPDGSPSHNLFGIKAGPDWKGAVAETMTTEYVNGVAQRKVERFRAYSSYAEGFQDYATLLRNNPRYAAALASGRNAEGFAQGLQRAGYATDPDYAEKLTRIIKGSRWT